MKKMKKLIAVIAAVGVLGTAGAAYAATVKTPAGETYGAIAKDAGKLDEFKAQMLEQKKIVLDQRVKDGTLTQQQADEIYNTIKDNQATCNGTGNAQIGKKFGAGRGQGMMGGGAGMGFGGGSCINR